MSIFGNMRMQIRKKWLNPLKNFFNKHFKEYYLASFAGESPQVVKITVPYCFHARIPVPEAGKRHSRWWSASLGSLFYSQSGKK